MAILNIALAGLETIINNYLRLDPETVSRLAKVSDKKIKVEISDWQMSYFVCPQTDGIQLFSEYHGEPDAVIRGKLIDLFRVGISAGETNKLFENQIEISGDIELGETVRDILAQIDIDWEEHLSQIVGDAVAHKIGFGVKRVFNLGKETTASFQRNLSEYLFEEAKTFPTHDQVNDFSTNVSILRDDVERAEARIKRLHEELAEQIKE